MKTDTRSDTYQPALLAFCVFALFWASFLLFAGGFTTSIDAGMAFLDWPLSNGSINPPGWTQDRDMAAEHSHRLLGMKLGILSIIMLIWTQLREQRRWVRTVAIWLFITICSQGLLGGLRVRFDELNIQSEDNLIAQIFLVLHACGAQLVLCLLVTLALTQTRFFREKAPRLHRPSSRLRHWGLASVILLSLTILAGAIMRHTEAGLAIPTFPYSSADHSLLPPTWNPYISVHFAHRVLALIASIALIGYASQLWPYSKKQPLLQILSLLPILLLVLQIFLGAVSIWTQLNEYATTLHMLNGAFLLASTWASVFVLYAGITRTVTRPQASLANAY